MTDWSEVLFLESVGNLKPLLRERAGRSPSTSVARDVSVCLQQGRHFYDAAAASPLAIRPLLVFYGMASFARALSAGTTFRGLATMRASHGLSDISARSCRLRDLRIRIGHSGAFQEFNDVVAPLTRLEYYTREFEPAAEYCPSANAQQLVDVELGLSDLLTRIPGLERLYEATFHEAPGTVPLFFNCGPCARWEMRADESLPFSDRSSLRARVGGLRARFPLFRRWRLIRASRSWGGCILEFTNLPVREDEFDEQILRITPDGFQAIDANALNDEGLRVDLKGLLTPLGGNFGHHNAAIAPVGERYLSEYSLLYMALYLLSSLVRYRPDTWSRAVTRSATPDAPADVELLALLESLLGAAFLLPSMVAKVLNPCSDPHSSGRLARLSPANRDAVSAPASSVGRVLP